MLAIHIFRYCKKREKDWLTTPCSKSAIKALKWQSRQLLLNLPYCISVSIYTAQKIKMKFSVKDFLIFCAMLTSGLIIVRLWAVLNVGCNNQIQTNVPFLCPLKTPESQFLGVRKGTLAQHGLMWVVFSSQFFAKWIGLRLILTLYFAMS